MVLATKVTFSQQFPLLRKLPGGCHTTHKESHLRIVHLDLHDTLLTKE